MIKIKAVMTHYSIIQKEVGKLLAKVAIEPLAVLAFTLLSLWFLSVLVVYDAYSALLDLIAICTYLLSTCLLSDKYDILFSRVKMLFLLISRMLIYMFLLLNITIAFSILFYNINLISGKFCHLGWLQLLAKKLFDQVTK